VHSLVVTAQQLQQASHCGRRSRQLPRLLLLEPQYLLPCRLLLLLHQSMQCPLHLVHCQLGQGGCQGGALTGHLLQGARAGSGEEGSSRQAGDGLPGDRGC
jgi:hypothetical protein